MNSKQGVSRFKLASVPLWLRSLIREGPHSTGDVEGVGGAGETAPDSAHHLAALVLLLLLARRLALLLPAGLLLLLVVVAPGGLGFAGALLHLQLLDADALRLQHTLELRQAVAQQPRRLVGGGFEGGGHDAVAHVN